MALSESSSLAGKGTLKLSSDARRSVHPRVCASVGVSLEPSAAFRHSEPGLKSARGSPGGRDADARAPRPLRGECASGGCIHDPLGVCPLPYRLSAQPLTAGMLPACCGSRASGGSLGLWGWASASASSGPKGAAAARSPLRFALARAARARPGAEVGGAHLWEGRADYLLCADPQSWKPERGGWCLREKAGSGAASTVLVGKWIKTSKWSFYKKLKDGAAGHLLPLALFKI